LLRAKYPPHLPNLLPLFHVVLCLLGTTHFLHRFCLISKKTGQCDSVHQETLRTWLKRSTEIILKCDEKERLLSRTSHQSPARSVLNRAEPKSNQAQLVTISCDEQAAADILRVAHQHHGSTWRVMHKQMKRLGLLKLQLNER
jgi:hypothetical protein